MNNIMPTISNVYLKNSGRLQQPQMQMNNASGGLTHSFSKQSPGLGSTLSGNTSLNNSAICIINAYFGRVNNNINKMNTKIGATSSSNNTSTSYFFISKPNFSHTNSKVTIKFFYYIASANNRMSTPALQNNESTIYHFSDLSTTLALVYQKEVNVVATRLYYPYLNSDIISQYLAHNAPSNTFMDFQEAILTKPSLHKTNLLAHISGIKVQVSGRLVTETVIPRITVKSCLVGSFRHISTNMTSVDYSKFTTKNELGAFTVKVWICQRSPALL